MILHTYDEVINGRKYQIEVSSVGPGQWRANIRRTPGGSAALMPFYGKTPDEAARQLSHWLALAHGQTAARAEQNADHSGSPVRSRGSKPL